MSRRTRKNGGAKYALSHIKGRRVSHVKKSHKPFKHGMANKVRNQLHKLETKRFNTSNMFNALRSIQAQSRSIKRKSKVVPMASRASTRKSGKSHAFNMLNQQNLENGLRESVKLQKKLKKAKKNGNAAKVAELESILAGFGL
jgi:hypothetical protein